jgi:hypothetical protein
MSDKHDAMSFDYLLEKYMVRDYAVGPIKEVARDPLPEALMTDEMRRAGSVALGFAPDHVTAGPQAALVYRAMRALEPAPSVDLFGEMNRIFQECRELLAFSRATLSAKEGCIAELQTALSAMRCGKDNLQERNAALGAELVDALMEVGARDARIADLEKQLTAFTAANVAPPEPDKLAHDPFRDHPTDRRRLGG